MPGLLTLLSNEANMGIKVDIIPLPPRRRPDLLAYIMDMHVPPRMLS